MRAFFSALLLASLALISGCASSDRVLLSGHETDPRLFGSGYVGFSATSLQGRPISSSAPSANYVLTWNGSTWAPAAGGGGGGGAAIDPTTTVVVIGDGLTTSNGSPDIQGGSDRDFHISSAAAHKIILSDTTNSGGAVVFDQVNSAVYPQTDQDDDLGRSSIAWSTLYVASITGALGGPLELGAAAGGTGQGFIDLPTDGSVSIEGDSGQGVQISPTGDVQLGNVGFGGLATTDTTGFPVIPSCAGTPTGAAQNGSLVIDSTNHKLCVRENGAWHSITLP